MNTLLGKDMYTHKILPVISQGTGTPWCPQVETPDLEAYSISENFQNNSIPVPPPTLQIGKLTPKGHLSYTRPWSHQETKLNPKLGPISIPHAYYSSLPSPFPATLRCCCENIYFSFWSCFYCASVEASKNILETSRGWASLRETEPF
jgi:hypothetical protein